MILLDSNIIIYATKLGIYGETTRAFIRGKSCAASIISRVEVLGYHRLSTIENSILTRFFDTIIELPISSAVIESSISLRQSQKMTLGDALIAATALTFGLQLVTHNTTDFCKISRLELIDPLSAL